MRILNDNRRHRQRGPDLTQWSLYAFSALLSLFGFFRRYMGGRKAKEHPARASDAQDGIYADHLYAELRRIGR